MPLTKSALRGAKKDSDSCAWRLVIANEAVSVAKVRETREPPMATSEKRRTRTSCLIGFVLISARGCGEGLPSTVPSDIEARHPPLLDSRASTRAVTR